MDKNYYDVIIVGGGTAGIFAALELAQTPGLKIALVEKGKDIIQRKCPARDSGKSCAKCSPCNLVCGLGGAGAFSDGKLVLSTQIGGMLSDYIGVPGTESLIQYVDDTYVKYGASNHLYKDRQGIEKLRRRASLAELRLLPADIRHLGTEHCYAVLKSMRDYLASRIEFRLGVAVNSVTVGDGGVTGVEINGGEKLFGKYVILAPGREGAEWLSREADRLRLTMNNNPVDVGVRVEVPAAVLEDLTSVLYEVKLEYLSRSFNDRIRTFCMCPGGQVIMETTGGCDPVISVNGHSYADRKSDYTNFAVLVSTNFTEPFREPIAYGKYIARLANLVSGGVLVQRLGDLIKGQRSTKERIARGLVKPTLKTATPGDLSFVLPYRHLTDIVEMLQAMDKFIPGIASPHTLLYGIEVKFYSCRPQLTPDLETEVHNLFAVGDGAGISRGLVQASASGVVAAREILKRAV